MRSTGKGVALRNLFICQQHIKLQAGWLAVSLCCGVLPCVVAAVRLA
jgi:hypothetical protein